MKLTWKDVIATDPGKKDYDENAQAITEMFQPNEDTQRSFTLLSENRTLIMLTKSILDEDSLQGFFHFIVSGSKLMKKKIKYYAFHGFGFEAGPVQLSPERTMTKTTTKRPCPPFDKMMMITDLDGF